LGWGKYSLFNGVANSVQLRLQGHLLAIGDLRFLIARAIRGSWLFPAMVLNGRALEFSALERIANVYISSDIMRTMGQSLLCSFKFLTKTMNGSTWLLCGIAATMELADKER
jgi:hypothetical protein